MRLSDEEATLSKETVGAINTAYERWIANGGVGIPAAWPKSLRVKAVGGAPGIWELSWSFAGPDGRATFEFVDVHGEPAIRWRRIGGHEVFKAP